MHIEPVPKTASGKSKHDVYYEGNKKNELNDLRIYFKKIVSNPDMHMFRREVIKKITNLTTQGVDTSRFYPEMVIASATNNLVQKKLVFNYLSIYSQLNADFARMAVNTFMKDSYSPNPNIRALAIRNLSNLRFKGRAEYVLPILKQGLSDFSPIPKKACLMGLAKLINEINRKAAEPVRDQELLNSLYGVLRDNNAQIVCCAIEAINEIEPEGIAMSKKLTNYLVDNIENGYDDTQLSAILNYVELYDPKSEQEAIQILNKLEIKTKSQNLSLVLSIAKIFLKYGSMFNKIMPKVHEIIQPCLLSFISHTSPEIEHTALQHVVFMIKKYKEIDYSKVVKKVYPKINDPTYLKRIKIEIMDLCCKEENFSDIVTEFIEYLREDDILGSIMDAFSRMILRFSQKQAKSIIKAINDVVLNISANEKICNAAIHTIRTFLRKYPEFFNMFQHTFYIYAKGVTSPEARCAMIEIIGDFGEHIEDAVELIVWAEGNLEDELKIALLRANVKLFFKRPIQMLNMITNLFRSIFSDEDTSLHVKDYATMLYLGLQNDIDSFKKSFLNTRSYSEGITIPLPDFELNTLEISYSRNKSEWLIEKNKYIELLEPIDYDEEGEGKGGVGEGEQIDPLVDLEKKRSKVDLSSNYSILEADRIDKNFEMDADAFENYWEEYDVGSSITRVIKQIEVVDEETLEELFQLWGVKTMASADSEQSIKQFHYLRMETGELACIELEISKQIETMTLLIKTEDDEFAGFVSKYIENFMKLNDII